VILTRLDIWETGTYPGEMTDDVEKPLHIFPSATGSLRMDSDLNWEEFQDVTAAITEEGKSHHSVSGRVEVWAGPYEFYMAIQPFIGDATGIVGAGTGIVSLLMQVVRRKPEHPVHIHIENHQTIIIDGKRELTQDETEAIEKLAADYNSDPNDPSWEPRGPGQ
jgi:hypothetical protein